LDRFGDCCFEMALSRAVRVPLQRQWNAFATVHMRSKITLPGRLGDPDMTLGTDPRVDPRIRAAFTSGPFAAFGMAHTDMGGGTMLEAPLEESHGWVKAVSGGWDEFFGEYVQWYKPIAGVIDETEVIKGVDGNDIKLTIHRPSNQSGPLPCAVRLHGGFLAGAEGDFGGFGPFAWWRHKLADSGMVVIGVGFRNSSDGAGAAPFPAGLNDVCSAVEHINANKAKYNISKVLCTGDNGGANLALAAAIKLKGTGLINGCFLQGPYVYGPHYMTNPDAIQSHFECDKFVVSRADCQVFAELYTPDPADAKNPLAWPYWATKEDLQGLPPQAILTEEVSFFRDEGAKLALKLKEAGVPTNCRMVVGGTWYASMVLEDLVEMQNYTIRAIKGFADNLP